ncbi:MAG: MarR family transcriptional regulator [Myxococcales bacterium]|nr:MarR family transcriptional regulator [Myxococcales bacterium]
MDALDARRSRFVARLMARISTALQQQVVQHLRAAGYDVTVAHNQVLIPLDQQGTRISELARRAGISAQAIGKLVTDLERKGLVERTPDPADGRARVVRYTDRGRALLRTALSRLDAQHAELAELLGPDRLEALRADLTRIAHHVDPEGF